MAFLDCIIFVAIALVFFSQAATDVITIAFLVIIGASMAVSSVIVRGRLNGIISSLESINELIKDAKDSSDILSAYETANLKSSFIRNALNAYLEDENPSKEISDYINDNVIAEYTWNEYSNWLPSFYTGLGILGTFIGLIIGLQKFEPGSFETIMLSISALMDGIKTAFYTSIFGVMASLLFGFFHKLDISRYNQNLDLFYALTERHISPSRELEKRKTDALEKLSGDIALELAKAINGSVVPVMTELKNATFGYIEKAVSTQSDTLEMLVNNFMEQLNIALKKQLSNMSSSIKELCSWQNSTSDALSKIFSQLEGTIGRLDNVNDNMGTIASNHQAIEQNMIVAVQKLKNYIDVLGDYQRCVEESTESMKKLSHQNESISKEFMNIPDKMIHLINEMEAVKATLDAFNRSIGEYISKYDEASLTLIGGVTQQNEKQAEKLENILKIFVESSADLFERVKVNFSETIKAQNEMSASYSKGLLEYTDKITDLFNYEVALGEKIDKTGAIHEKLHDEVLGIDAPVAEIKEKVEKIEEIIEQNSQMLQELNDASNKEHISIKNILRNRLNFGGEAKEKKEESDVQKK